MGRKILLICFSLFLIGCAVVNVYVTFPEEKIKKAAEDILAPPEQPQSFFNIFITKNVYAEEIKVRKELKTDSPKIREAKEKINSWREKINNFKKLGFIGEANNFKVVIKNLPSDSKKSSEVREIVRKENQQREIIIKEIMRINNAAPSEEKKFREIFSEVSQKYSPQGTWIQTVEGKWIKKK